MSHAIARRILYNQFKTITFTAPAGKTAPPVITENFNYDPDNRQPFIRWTFEPVETEIMTMGYGVPSKKLQGYVRVAIFVPRGTGVNKMYEWADQVINAYPASTWLKDDGGTVHLKSAWQEIVIEEPDWSQLQVFVRWFSTVQQTLNTSSL